MWYEIQQVSQGTEGLEGEEKKEERKLTSHKYIQYELKRKWLVGGGSRGSLLLLALASGCLGGWSCVPASISSIGSSTKKNLMLFNGPENGFFSSLVIWYIYKKVKKVWGLN